MSPPPTTTLRPSWSSASRLALTVAFVAYVSSILFVGRPPSGWDWRFDGLLSNTVLVGSGLVMVATTRRGRASELRVLAMAVLLWALGNVVWTIWVRPLAEPPYPSYADWMWLAFYPAAAAGLLQLTRTTTSRIDAGLVLDGILGGCAAAAAVSAFVFDSVVRANTGDRMTVLVNLAYPIGDLVLIMLVVATGVVRGVRDRRWWLLLIGLGVFDIGDSVYVAQVANDTYNGGLVDISWITGLFLLSFTTTRAAAHDGGDSIRGGRRMAALPVVFSLVSLVFIVLHELLATSDLSLYLAVVALAASVPRLLIAGRDASRLANAHAQARTDELTGLANRRGFYEALAAELGDPDRAGDVAVLLLDLNGFKAINDSLGHQAGDEALRVVARRLRHTVALDDRVARIGGDEFAIATRVSSEDQAVDQATTIAAALADPVVVRHRTFTLQASVGVAIGGDGADADELLARADEAMYATKRRHGPPNLYRHRAKVSQVVHSSS